MSSTENQEVLDAALTLIHSRQQVSPGRFTNTGPNVVQLEKILTPAGAAPDHGQHAIAARRQAVQTSRPD